MIARLCLLLLLFHPAPARQEWQGYAAQHRSLERVARVRGMDASGVLFASPIAPVGSRLCVSSVRVPHGICGTVVDGPRPEHRDWQIRTGRIIEVQPSIARHLCRDASGPPRDCPVEVRRDE